MSWRRPSWRPAAVLLALAAMCSPAAPQAPRVVAVGDVHGAYDALVAILHQAALVDADGHWSGGDAVFVQTGDFFDRGAGSWRPSTPRIGSTQP